MRRTEQLQGLRLRLMKFEQVSARSCRRELSQFEALSAGSLSAGSGLAVTHRQLGYCLGGSAPTDTNASLQDLAPS